MNKGIDKLKQSFSKMDIERVVGHLKGTWNVSSKITEIRSKTTKIYYLETDGNTVTDPVMKA